MAIKLLHASSGRAADSEDAVRRSAVLIMARLSHQRHAVYDVGTARAGLRGHGIRRGRTLTDWLEHGGHGWEAISDVILSGGAAPAGSARGAWYRDFKARQLPAGR